MNTRFRVGALAAALLAFAAAGCAKIDPIAAPVASTGDADFSSYVAMGTSISAGLQSGGLLDIHQMTSAPALIAQQTGANGGTFVQPLLASPGVPPLLIVTSLSPLTFGTLPGAPPAGPYVARPADGYDNLSIPGVTLAAAIAKPNGFPFYDLVLQGQGTMLRQCVAQNPTFVTVELGSNDCVLSLLTGGNPALLTPPATFAIEYGQILDSLATFAPNAKLALANVPPVTTIPYVTTVPLVINAPVGPGGSIVPVRLRDANGPLPDGSLILLPASSLVQVGYGFPSPAPPLPDSLVITLAERATIEDAVTQYNATIAAAASAHGAALVDEYGTLTNLYQHGLTLGGVHYSTAFVAGGLFSFDGVHPSTLGSGILANTFLESINRKFGARIPLVDLSALAANEPASLFAAERR